MKIRRILRHVFHTRGALKRAFPDRVLLAIERAISESEAKHAGEISFVVEGALDGAPLYSNHSTRERALEVFSSMRVWDTEQNNGVLIYVLLAEREVELVADRGISSKVAAEAWQQICDALQAAFRDSAHEQGVLSAITKISSLLAAHYPPVLGRANQLSDSPLAQVRGHTPRPAPGSQRDFP